MPLPTSADTTKPYTKIHVNHPVWVSSQGQCPPGTYLWPGNAVNTLFLSGPDKVLLSTGKVVCEYFDPSEPEVIKLPEPVYTAPLDVPPVVFGNETTSLAPDMVSAQTPSGLVQVVSHEDDDLAPIVILDDVVSDKTAAKVVTHEDNLRDTHSGAGAKPADKAGKPR
jgi:hypothetical protein